MERCIPTCCSYTSTPSSLQSPASKEWFRCQRSFARRHKGSAVFCSSTRRFNPPGGDRGGGRGGLILPGQNGSAQDGQQSKLIVPGGRGNEGNQQPNRGGNSLSGGALLDVENKTSVNTFRPPPGFMDADGPKTTDAEPEVQDPQVLLNRLRASAGKWHELALLVPLLSTLGVDNTIIEAETGIERAQLNAWQVSVQVYESLRRSGELSESQMAYFDRDDGAELLYEMRLLSVSSRPPLAAYIADNELDPPMATLLSRSVKEQLRRKGENEGFSQAPGDCLAYKYYRDAVESKKENAKLAYVEKGLDVAVTDAARAKLKELLDRTDEAQALDGGAAPVARLEMFRLTREEMAFQPVPLLPNLQRLTAAALDGVPRLRQSGPFSAFTVPAAVADQQWVALPAWNLIRRAKVPVAINIDDCLHVPAVVAAANPRTAEAKQRLKGPALLVVDCNVEKVSEDNFYLVEPKEGTQLEILEGTRLNGTTPCAQILFCCRPPAMGFTGSQETSELLQV